MKTGDFRDSLATSLITRYGNDEANAIANTFIAHHLGLLPSQVSQHSGDEMPADLMKVLSEGMLELQSGVPVQYVLKTAWFLGHPYFVNNEVLIPRPETEELVMLVINELKKRPRNQLQLLDLGTGSGCIPIALQKQFPEIKATGTDVSEAALKVARYNAEQLQSRVQFICHDMTTATFPDNRIFDIIISNPPYIPPSEHRDMQEHVTNFEPHLALFTPNNDTLFFYRSIVSIALKHLKEGGGMFLEIHYDKGEAVSDLLVQAGMQQVTIKKDLSGNDRFVTATR